MDPIAAAKQVLGGTDLGSDELIALAYTLKSKNEFGYAWRVFSRGRSANNLTPEVASELCQQQALCTYKDVHLHADQRLERALSVLEEGEDLQTTTDPETLGLAGAIHKRLWQVRNHRRDLERALHYYRRGHQSDRESNFYKKEGYPGINTAFVLDLLASLEEFEDDGSVATANLTVTRRGEAAAVREEIVKGLEGILESRGLDGTANQWWPVVTLAEAHFGLRHYEETGRWLKRAAEIPDVEPWAFETLARQLTSLAKLLEGAAVDSPAKFAESPAGRALRSFLGDRSEGVLTSYLGKVGLALSGGGFRASLYHIGVLARLAELDVLRHVEVLSCVSGGSILGAYFYLELRELLRTKADTDITHQDYIDLVKRVEQGFLKGVQTNVRTRVAAELFTNLKMIFSSNYSRTQRVGELYERWIYSNVKDGDDSGQRWLTDLFVIPKGEAESFRPVTDNWRRANKVPILILNATTLNTGHNWQFTASWMGEPPTAVDPEIDSNYRLRRMYYHEAPKSHRRVRLGTAVGASACVPGLFEPIVMEDLYDHSLVSGPSPGKASKITVRLVDGGVHDNQGLVGLIEQDCDVMLVSDASGQMETEDDPSHGILGVPLRANSILMARVREAEYDDLVARRAADLVRNFMYVHLKMGLDADPVDWVGCDEPQQVSEDARPPERRGPFAPYGIRKTVQRLLAGSRTDLDSFNDAEAYALMYSGYRMTGFQFGRSVRGFPEPPRLRAPPRWQFLEVEPILEKAKDGDLIMQILEVGSELAFKIWKLWLPLKIARVLLTLVALTGAAWAYYEFRSASLFTITVNQIAVGVTGLVLTAVLGKWVMRIVRFRETLSKILIGIGMSSLGFLLARLHLHVFDKIYLWFGRLDRIRKLSEF